MPERSPVLTTRTGPSASPRAEAIRNAAGRLWRSVTCSTRAPRAGPRASATRPAATEIRPLTPGSMPRAVRHATSPAVSVEIRLDPRPQVRTPERLRHEGRGGQRERLPAPGDVHAEDHD